MLDANITHCFVIVLVGKESGKMPCSKPVVEKRVLSTGVSTVFFIIGIESYP